MLSTERVARPAGKFRNSPTTNPMRTFLTSIAALFLASSASAQVLPYSQDFESLDQMEITALNP